MVIAVRPPNTPSLSITRSTNYACPQCSFRTFILRDWFSPISCSSFVSDYRSRRPLHVDLCSVRNILLERSQTLSHLSVSAPLWQPPQVLVAKLTHQDCASPQQNGFSGSFWRVVMPESGRKLRWGTSMTAAAPRLLH